MESGLFVRSLLLGLAIAAPLGPIGTLCINRTLAQGLTAGMVGGLGTALADGIYAVLAALGFAVFTDILTTLNTPLRLFGGVFLVWLGYHSMAPAAGSGTAKVSPHSLYSILAASFVLTLTNPMTILSFAAIFASLGLADRASPADAIWVVFGVFSGSLLWWLILSSTVAFARHRLSAIFVRRTAYLSGITLIGFGLWAISSVMW